MDKNFNRANALKMAAEHGSFTPEQLDEWTEMYHKKGKLSDGDIEKLADRIPKARELRVKIQAEKAAAAVITGEVKGDTAICKTCSKEFVKVTWNQVYCPECKAAQKK